MLTALDTNGNRIVSTEATRGDPYVCPECHQPVLFKRGEIVIPHFAHKVASPLCSGNGESLRHQEMKLQIAEIFASWNPELEVPILPDQRADVVFGDVVVECQASPLLVEEWESRTRAYNAKGYKVLWVWDIKRLGTLTDEIRAVAPLLGEKGQLAYELRIPAEMLHCHQLSYGTVYVLGDVPTLIACHFLTLKRIIPPGVTKTGDDYGGEYWLKRTKRVEVLPLENPAPKLKTGPKGHRLVELGEGVWFTPRKDHLRSGAYLA